MDFARLTGQTTGLSITFGRWQNLPKTWFPHELIGHFNEQRKLTNKMIPGSCLNHVSTKPAQLLKTHRQVLQSKSLPIKSTYCLGHRANVISSHVLRKCLLSIHLPISVWELPFSGAFIKQCRNDDVHSTGEHSLLRLRWSGHLSIEVLPCRYSMPSFREHGLSKKLRADLPLDSLQGRFISYPDLKCKWLCGLNKQYFLWQPFLWVFIQT